MLIDHTCHKKVNKVRKFIMLFNFVSLNLEKKVSFLRTFSYSDASVGAFLPYMPKRWSWFVGVLRAKK